MLATLIYVFESLELALRLQLAVPTIKIPDAYEHAAAAVAAATPRVTPELLLAVAFVESRYDTTTLSRVQSNRRRTGRFPSRRPPRDLDRKASLFCGPLQTHARSWQECLAHREHAVAYAVGVTELEAWLRDRRVRGNVARALAGHGCGNHGVTTGRCNAYPARVLRVERKLLAARSRSLTDV
jgi:hypothetical protein